MRCHVAPAVDMAAKFCPVRHGRTTIEPMGRGADPASPPRFSPLYGIHPRRDPNRLPLNTRSVSVVYRREVRADRLQPGDWLWIMNDDEQITAIGPQLDGSLIQLHTRRSDGTTRTITFTDSTELRAYRRERISGERTAQLEGGEANGVQFPLDGTPPSVSVFVEPSGTVMIRDGQTMRPGPSGGRWGGTYRLEDGSDRQLRYKLSASPRSDQPPSQSA